MRTLGEGSRERRLRDDPGNLGERTNRHQCGGRNAGGATRRAPYRVLQCSGAELVYAANPLKFKFPPRRTLGTSRPAPPRTGKRTLVKSDYPTASFLGTGRRTLTPATCRPSPRCGAGPRATRTPRRDSASPLRMLQRSSATKGRDDRSLSRRPVAKSQTFHCPLLASRSSMKGRRSK